MDISLASGEGEYGEGRFGCGTVCCLAGKMGRGRNGVSCRALPCPGGTASGRAVAEADSSASNIEERTSFRTAAASVNVHHVNNSATSPLGSCASAVDSTKRKKMRTRLEVTASEPRRTMLCNKLVNFVG